MSEKGRRVLVVDDNPDAAEMLALVLTRHGHQAEVAGDAPEALEVFERFRPDVALLDIGLPSMDGHELARELEKRAEGELLLVAVTGTPEDSSVPSAFSHYLLKPIATRTLLRLIEG